LDHLIEMLIQVYTPLQTVSKDLNIPLARGLAELDKEFSAAVEARADEAVVNKVLKETGAGLGPLLAGITDSLGP